MTYAMEWTNNHQPLVLLGLVMVCFFGALVARWV